MRLSMLWKSLLLLAISVFVCTLVFILTYSRDDVLMNLVSQFNQTKSLFYRHSTCVHRAIFDLTYQEVWNEFADLSFQCQQSSKFNLSALMPLENRDEIKYHVLARDNSTKCVVLSIGVGHDIISEKQLAKRQPHCRFIGVDPMVTGNKELYESIGTFHALAIGNDSKTVESLIINGNDNGYHYENVTTTELQQFLQHFVKEDLIDQVFLDAEYAEFQLFEYLLEGGLLEDTGIIICQVNIEIHKPDDTQKKTFDRFVRRLLRQYRYAPFNVVNVAGAGHIRLVLINYFNDECVDRYLHVRDEYLVI